MSDGGHARRAVFVDRDGVLNELVPDPASGRLESPLRAEDVQLADGVASALSRLRESGFKLIGVSNQPAAAKGTLSVADLVRVQARVVELLGSEGVTFDGFEICLHHPEGTVPELSGPCDCRKPAPGMLLAAATRLEVDLPRSWMVGDTDADIAAGQAAGCRTILVRNPGSAHKQGNNAYATATAPDLAAAARIILAA